MAILEKFNCLKEHMYASRYVSLETKQWKLFNLCYDNNKKCIEYFWKHRRYSGM